jgi:hypothetical protein
MADLSVTIEFDSRENPVDVAVRAEEAIRETIAEYARPIRCECGCGCNYRLDGYAEGERICGACIDNCRAGEE